MHCCKFIEIYLFLFDISMTSSLNSCLGTISQVDMCAAKNFGIF
jgi:hypothetical protein